MSLSLRLLRAITAIGKTIKCTKIALACDHNHCHCLRCTPFSWSMHESMYTPYTPYTIRRFLLLLHLLSDLLFSLFDILSILYRMILFFSIHKLEFFHIFIFLYNRITISGARLYVLK